MSRDFKKAHADLLRRVTSDKGLGFAIPREDLPDVLRDVLHASGRMRLYQLHTRLIDPRHYEVDESGLILFAEENQSVIRWAFNPEEGDDAPVYQQELGEETYGPWVKDTPSMSKFLLTLAYWNAANGGADATCVGEATESTRAKIRRFDVVWKAPDFLVHDVDGAFVIVTEDLDYYAFGKDPKRVRQLTDVLEPAWVDYEPSENSRVA